MPSKDFEIAMVMSKPSETLQQDWRRAVAGPGWSRGKEREGDDGREKREDGGRQSHDTDASSSSF